MVERLLKLRLGDELGLAVPALQRLDRHHRLAPPDSLRSTQMMSVISSNLMSCFLLAGMRCHASQRTILTSFGELEEGEKMKFREQTRCNFAR